MNREVENPLGLPPLLVTATFLVPLGLSALGYVILHQFWGSHMLMSFNQLEKDGFVAEGLGRVWFIFAWALAVSLLVALVLKQRFVSNESRVALMLKGWWLSLNAGFFEEIIYRGFVFLCAMVTLPWLDTITFGLVKWFYVDVSIPAADWGTFHVLHAQLTGHPNWVFGAAIVSASVSFRDEHKYQGFFGWVNSWYIGMVMFYLVFHYGLATAIAAHVLYDVVVFTVAALSSERETHLSQAIKRALGSYYRS